MSECYNTNGKVTTAVCELANCEVQDLTVFYKLHVLKQ